MSAKAPAKHTGLVNFARANFAFTLLKLKLIWGTTPPTSRWAALPGLQLWCRPAPSGASLWTVPPSGHIHHQPLLSCRELCTQSTSCPPPELPSVPTGPLLFHCSTLSSSCCHAAMFLSLISALSEHTQLCS